MNPASLAGGAATPTLPLQGLQVQTLTPQLLLNTQGQIIATVGNGPTAVATSAAVLPKAAAPPTLAKPSSQVGRKTAILTLLLYLNGHTRVLFAVHFPSQASVTAVTQSPVVIAPQPSVLKTATTTLSSSVPITCGDIAKVGQLVSSMYTCSPPL